MHTIDVVIIINCTTYRYLLSSEFSKKKNDIQIKLLNKIKSIICNDCSHLRMFGSFKLRGAFCLLGRDDALLFVLILLLSESSLT